MKKTKFTTPFKDGVFTTGLMLFGIAALIFGLTMALGDLQSETFTGSFFAIFILFWVYFFMVIIQNKAEFDKRFRFKSIRRNIVLLQLANLSAYSLNRTIPVFQDSADWLIGFLLLYHAALFAYCFRSDDKPDSINYAILLTLGAGSVFHLYESIFLAELYPITLFTFWFFGISLLSLVPLWHLLLAVHIIRGYLKSAPDSYRPLLMAAVAIPLVMIGVYVTRWNHVSNEINRPFALAEEPLNENLYPNWVESAQSLKDDAITKRILKAGSVYQTASQFRFTNNFSLQNERRRHDPFVVISSFFTQSNHWYIPQEDRVHLLNTLYDQRHQTAPKLWRSDHLVTELVKTQVQLFPEYRLAYTEKTITIANQQPGNVWRGQEEALYTFHLPEGAVISSASLWIEGQEALAHLTTRSKADSAYRTIVGVESRDPLLVHWQEGNQVTARIFPVMAGETRQFKIGFSTPLRMADKELVYENIDFAGPHWQFAQEQVSVVASGDIADMHTPWSFNEEGNNWKYNGRYQSDWQLRFAAPPLAETVFSFNGRGFQLQEQLKKQQAFDPEAIYLDINSGWKKQEVLNLWEAIQDKDVYVYTNRLEKITAANHKRLFKLLLARRFSLFPFFKITAPESAIVVSAYSRLTPNLSDLEDSEFADKLGTYLQNRSNNIKFFNLGSDLSPYLRSLRDLRLFDYEEGDMEELLSLLQQGVFTTSTENATTVVNAYAGVQIQEIEAENTAAAAPDHLLRLYAYNDLLKKIGKDYFNKDQIADQLINQAAEAHIVTPVSSMIVLESQADYDRFGIERSKDSLGNASISESGSVPEPHEWLLLLLSLLLMGYLWRKDQLKTA